MHTAAVGHVPEVSVEEFIDGREFTFDTVCVEGQPVYENVAEYLPRPLVARSIETLSPVIITVRDMDQAHLAAGIALGRNVLTALQMHDGFTHMEWFLTSDGEAVFGEIGARPGGAHLVDQMNYTSDIDLFREWARVVCWHAFDVNAHRLYNAAIIFKRARGQGRIQAIEGLDHVRALCGPCIVEERLLPIGAPRRNWKHTPRQRRLSDRSAPGLGRGQAARVSRRPRHRNDRRLAHARIFRSAPIARRAPDSPGRSDLRPIAFRSDRTAATLRGRSLASVPALDRGLILAGPNAPVQSAIVADGHVSGNESCDDGNTTNGDGCSSTCKSETPAPRAAYRHRSVPRRLSANGQARPSRRREATVDRSEG